MARTDQSRYESEPRRPRGGLTLSTGRFEGRPGSSDHTAPRHNPLRDEYPQSRDRDYYRDPDAARRHSGSGHSAQERSHSPEASRRAPRRPGRGAHRRPSFSIGGFLGAATRFDARRIAAAAFGVVVIVIFAMALLHVGPFAPVVVKDGSKHVGVHGANAVSGNASYLAQNIALQLSIARPVEPELAKLPTHSPTREDVSRLSSQENPFAFAAADLTDENGKVVSPPVLSDRSLVALNNALAYYDTNDYDVSFLFMDLGTGRGIAGNIDEPIYGASTFKGPYCAYVVSDKFPDDINTVKASRVTQVENAIVWSDNSSYGKLRRAYGTDGMEEWLTEAGVDTELVHDTYFPTYTARQSALMWLKIYDYLATAGTSAAQWLSDTFAKTEVSFLRNGALGTTSAGHTDYLPEEGTGGEEGVEAAEGDSDDEAVSLAAEEDEPVGDGEELVAPADEPNTVASIGTNIVVRNKAGWISDAELQSISDAGIVTINGRDYLMVIMTGAPDSAEGEQAFAHLARTLFEIRSDLA